jgi:ABC-type multidrug transport system fused ATPase/permease subunit
VPGFSGKSSLTLALFRIIEAAGGSISIDGQVCTHLQTVFLKL